MKFPPRYLNLSVGLLMLALAVHAAHLGWWGWCISDIVTGVLLLIAFYVRRPRA